MGYMFMKGMSVGMFLVSIFFFNSFQYAKGATLIAFASWCYTLAVEEELKEKLASRGG